MGSSMLHPQGGVPDAASSAQREALLGLLGTSPLAREDVATLAVGDPLLVYAVFHACPLEGGLEHALTEALAERIERIGPSLLSAWLALQAGTRESGSRTDLALRGFAARCADLALKLAIHSAYPFPEEARLAGLWSRLSQMLRLDPAHAGRVGSAAALNARLAEECGAHGPLSDALELVEADDEQILSAHPLARLLWCASRLACPDGGVPDAVLARVADVETTFLHEIRERCLIPLDARGTPEATALAPTAVPPVPRNLLEAALAGYARTAFEGLAGDALRARLHAGARLLCATEPALVVVARGERLEALPLTDARTEAHWTAAGMPLDDPVSVVALAARSATPTSYHGDEGGGPARSVRDWQLARWIGRNGFVCVPFSCEGAPAAIVVAPERVQMPPADATRMLLALVSAAASVASAQQRHNEAERALRREIETLHREHARRIAHEARNPLSVIRSYLQLMPQRHPDASGLAEDMDVVQAEIDRLGALIDASTEAPQAAVEPGFCRVPELLHDLRAMVGEPLFARRGIHLELRTSAGLPPIAIPPSKLRQVLLNLLHNAADILHPGGRCTIALAGEVWADGVRCLEIRVIDNGPGLPPERLADPFTPRPSAKGGHHEGLGLAISRQLLAEWHGRILCRSQNGVGTSFQLLVPVHDSE